MRLFTVAAVVTAASLAGGIPARAMAAPGGCTSAPENEWLPLDQLKSKVQAQGYVVWKGRIENGCAEIAAYPTNTGALDRLFVDPSTGRIVEVR
jgi:hypothetical protein